MCTYIVLLEEAEVANYSYPHQQCRRSQQNPAHVIGRDVLKGEGEEEEEEP